MFIYGLSPFGWDSTVVSAMAAMESTMVLCHWFATNTLAFKPIQTGVMRSVWLQVWELCGLCSWCAHVFCIPQKALCGLQWPVFQSMWTRIKFHSCFYSEGVKEVAEGDAYAAVLWSCWETSINTSGKGVYLKWLCSTMVQPGLVTRTNKLSKLSEFVMLER